MNKVKNFWRMGLSVLSALMVQMTAHAWVPEDMGPKPGYIKCGITLYDKANNSLLPYVTMRFNFRGSSGGDAYFYLTSDSQGFAYLEVPMKNANGIIAGVDGNQNFDLKCLAGYGRTGCADTDPLDGSGWTWGQVAAGLNTRWFLTGHHAVQLPQGVSATCPRGTHDNAGLNAQISPGRTRYDWLDVGCSIHFACYTLWTGQGATHNVTFNLTGVANTTQFASRAVAHGTDFNTNEPENVDPDWKFDHWQVYPPSHPEATVDAPTGALSVKVNQTICLKPVWRYDPGGGPSEDDPIYQFCHNVEHNMLKVAMKVYDWSSGEPLKNVTVGLCFTIPNPNPNPQNPGSEVRRDNVVSATTDANGELKMLVPFESDGYILVNGVKSTEINLNKVTKIDCGPDAAIGWNWDTQTAGRVRNYPSGYGVNTMRLVPPGGKWHDAIVVKNDADYNGVWDYVEEGASLYFECYLKHVSGGDLRSIFYDRATIQNEAAFKDTTCAHGSVYEPPATPIHKTSPDRAFLGWICKPLTIENKEAAYTDGAFNYAAPLTVNENLMFVPVWGPNPDAVGRIRFQVKMWDHNSYWDHEDDWKSNPDVLGPEYGHTGIVIDGLTFVLKTYDSIYHTTLPDSVKRPVGRPNTPEGWADSRVEVNYNYQTGTWDAVYEISNEQLQYLNSNWIIDTDPDEHDLATYDRDLGYGPETVTFDWDWFIKKDDREGAGLTGVRMIPECQRRGGIYPNGLNKNDVIQLDDEMIANGFDFTFQCWVVPALVVDFDTDDGTPKTYPEQRFLPLDSCPFWEQRFQAENPGSPTRGGNEHFEGWYEILSTDQYGNDTLANAPWNFGKTVEHSMTLKAVYRKTGYDVTTTDPAVIRVTGPGTLTFEELLNNPNGDSDTRLSITVDGGEPIYVTSKNMSTYETKTIVFGGEVDIEHVVEVTFSTTQTGAGTSASVKLDQVQWVPYDTGITDAVADRESTIFKVENLGTNPADETKGRTFFIDGNGTAVKDTISTVDAETGRQLTSVVNPAGGATADTKGTEDYWYVNYDSQRNQLLPTGVQQIFAETPPTLSAGEKTSFQVTGITGASVIRWESFVTDGAAGDTVPSELTVTVTLTPKNGPVRTETHVYPASYFTNGEFKPELLDFKDEPVSTQIVLDFTYTNNDQGDGRAYVDNIYWKCVQEQGGHTWIDPEPEEGVALMIVDHEDAGNGYVYLAFTPQIKEGFDPQEWFKSSTKQGFFKVKTDASRSGVEGTEPVQIELSDIHSSTPEKVWVKVPLSVVEAGEFSRLFVGGKPIPYKNLDGSTNYTSQAGSGATSVNTFGDLKVVTKTANTMVAVPWTWYSDQENNAMPIPADKLVKTENLSENDMLYSYSESGVYLAWTVKGKHWVPMTTLTQESPTPVGANSVAITPGQVTLPRGAGVWVVRHNPTDGSGNAIPFWIYGQSVNTPAETVITPPQNGEDSHSTMLGNPFPVGMKINDLVFEGTIGENDTIIVPNGTDSPKYLQYRDTGTGRTRSGTKKWAWAYVDTSTGKPKNMYDWDVTVPPGLAFWYVRRGMGVLKVKWNVPSSGK